MLLFDNTNLVSAIHYDLLVSVTPLCVNSEIDKNCTWRISGPYKADWDLQGMGFVERSDEAWKLLEQSSTHCYGAYCDWTLTWNFKMLMQNPTKVLSLHLSIWSKRRLVQFMLSKVAMSRCLVKSLVLHWLHILSVCSSRSPCSHVLGWAQQILIWPDGEERICLVTRGRISGGEQCLCRSLPVSCYQTCSLKRHAHVWHPNSKLSRFYSLALHAGIRHHWFWRPRFIEANSIKWEDRIHDEIFLACQVAKFLIGGD